MKSLFVRVLLFFLLTAAFLGPASAQVLLVGGDAQPFTCNHSDIQSAIDAADPDEVAEIRIANNQSYSNQSLVINDRSITLRGGYGSCVEAANQIIDLDQRTVLDGGAQGRVIDITAPPGAGREVRLENLLLREGAADQGAGMRVRGERGSVTVTLRNVRVRNSEATAFGGGVAVVMDGDPALNDVPLLVFGVSGPGTGKLDWNVRLESNRSATESGSLGGGLACRGNASAFNTAPVVIVDRGLFLGNGAGSSNNTTGGGGGIALQQCSALLALGSPGGEAGIFDNDARLQGSGGILLAGGSELMIHGDRIDGRGTPGRAAVIGENINGGLFAVDSRVLASGLVLVDNVAGTSASVALRLRSSQFELLPGTAPATDCLAAQAGRVYPACNLISGTRGTLQSTRASALSLDSSAGSPTLALLSSVVIRDNGPIGGGSSTPSVADLEGDVSLMLRHALILDNTNGSSLFRRSGSGQAKLDIAWSTIAANQIANLSNAAVIQNAGSAGNVLETDIAGSVIWQPERVLFSGDPGNSSIRCMIGNQPASELPVDTTAFYDNIDPEFANLASGDLRPGPSSPLIDYCDGQAIQGDLEGDINGVIRGISYDMPITPAPNRVPGGRFDLGAFEREQERLFQDRFQTP
jgi:hypothetical protein